MGECSDTLALTDHDGVTAANGSSHETGIEDENRMSVDIVVKDGTAAEAVSSDNIAMAADLPASATQPVSIAADVIDVDAVDVERSCDKAQKDKSINSDNPLELGLNEYYLQPASDERPADDVIDVDAEATQAAGLSETAAAVPATTAHTSLANDAGSAEILKNVEEESRGNEATEVDAETGTASPERIDDKSDEGLAVVTGVEVQCTEPVSASSSSLADEKKTSAVDAESGKGNSVSVNFANDQSNGDDTASDSCTEVQELELVEASSTEPHDVQRLEAADTVVTDVAVMVTEVIDRVIASQECSADEDVVIDAHVHIKAPQQVTVEAGNDTDVTSPRAAVEPEVEILNVPVKGTSSLCDTEEATAKPVQGECVESYSRDGEMIVDSKQTDVGKPVNEEHASVHRIESGADVTDGRGVTDKARPDNYTAEPMETTDKAASGTDDAASDSKCTAQLIDVTDKPASDVEDKSQSSETMDIIVCDSEDTKESAEVISSAAAVYIESDQQLPDPQLAENPTDAAEGRGVTDRASSVGESTTQPVTDNNAAAASVEVKDVVTEVAVSSAEDMQQIAESVNESTEVMQNADASLTEDMTDVTANGNTAGTVKAVTDEDCVMQHKDVSDIIETSQQPVEMTPETDNGEGVSQCKEMKDVADTDEKGEQHHADVTDEMRAAKSDAMDTGVLMTESATLAASDKGAPPAGVMTAVLADDDGCNRQATDVTDKTEAAAEDTELTHIHVSDVVMKHTADCGKTTGKDTTGMELQTCESSTAGEIAVSEASAEFHGGKSEQEEMEMTVDPPTSADGAAQ